ncbi:hypothetical protein FOCC_FOCC014246 [Frankliniella occidentalis]|nr:hypothetical protein FOCC_FOCC014246 [Frankliniella occidentalis]
MAFSKCVSLLGPLWATSCFKFENLNGQLANLVQGTRYAGLQIHSNIETIAKHVHVIGKKYQGLKRSVRNLRRQSKSDVEVRQAWFVEIQKDIETLRLGTYLMPDEDEVAMAVASKTLVKVPHEPAADNADVEMKDDSAISRVSEAESGVHPEAKESGGHESETQTNRNSKGDEKSGQDNESEHESDTETNKNGKEDDIDSLCFY